MGRVYRSHDRSLDETIALKILRRDLVDVPGALDRFRQEIDERGWGFWAVEVEGELAGITGLSQPSFSAHFTPCTEIGWRFHRRYWGHGIAFAAAQKADEFAFSVLRLEQLVSFTTATNLRSRRLMERLGFDRNPADDFPHPRVADDHPLGAAGRPRGEDDVRQVPGEHARLRGRVRLGLDGGARGVERERAGTLRQHPGERSRDGASQV